MTLKSGAPGGWREDPTMRAETVIEALFFDGDQTLWDFEKLIRRALAATLDELRRLCPGPATVKL